ncbi:MAG: export transporter permease LptF [Pseudomonadota bacterium]|jgi:lipopolysaccharide export system permease protein
MILFRYITVKIALNLGAVTGILLIIALSNRFSSYLAKTASGQLPVEWIFKLVALHVPELMSLLLPLCLMMSLLFTYGKLYANSEFIVMLSSGISPKFVLKITLFVAMIVASMVAYLTLYLNPLTTDKREKVMSEAENVGLLQSVIPGRFQSLGDGKTVLYIEGLDTKNHAELRMDNVFIAELNGNASQLAQDKDKSTILIAQHAQEKKRQGNQRYLVLNNGYRYTGIPGTADYTVIRFSEYGRELQHAQQNEAPSTPEHRAKSLMALLHSQHTTDKAELGWRFSLSFSAFVLALLALPLSAVNPRQGRFAHFLPCILLYIAYYNFLIVGKRWASAGIVNPWLGMGTVHLAFLSYAIYQLRQWARGRR